MAAECLRVVQTVFGRFHHFDLARQLHRHGCLEAIFTAYPQWKVRREALPPKCVRTFPWLMTPLMAKWRCGWHHTWLDREWSWLVAETLDRHVARHLPDCDVFVGISGTGWHTAQQVRRRGRRFVCDRGSAHIHFMDRILRDEFKRWGHPFVGIDSRIIDKEEREYALADVVTVPSEFSRKSFIGEGVEAAKLRVIPYGVDLQEFVPEGQPSANEFQVLFVGAVSFQKGVPYLLEAFERLRHPQKRLLIAGGMSPEMRAFLKDRAWPGVEFLGPQPRSVVRKLMSESHVFVLPSIQDGFGMVLAEAMACGCPVIGTEHTGAPDLVTEGREGFVVPIRDAQAIGTRLQNLAEDHPLREEMGVAARRRVQRMGGWDDYGDQFAAICRELAGSCT